MIIEPFVLRRTKKEVLKELPDKTTIVLNNEMIEEQEKIYLSSISSCNSFLASAKYDKYIFSCSSCISLFKTIVVLSGNSFKTSFFVNSIFLRNNK